MKLSIKATSKESKKPVIKSSNERIDVDVYNQDRERIGWVMIELNKSNKIDVYTHIDMDNIPS